jgi:hypothetical protein
MVKGIIEHVAADVMSYTIVILDFGGEQFHTSPLNCSCWNILAVLFTQKINLSWAWHSLSVYKKLVAQINQCGPCRIFNRLFWATCGRKRPDHRLSRLVINEVISSGKLPVYALENHFVLHLGHPSVPTGTWYPQPHTNAVAYNTGTEDSACFMT